MKRWLVLLSPPDLSTDNVRSTYLPTSPSSLAKGKSIFWRGFDPPALFSIVQHAKDDFRIRFSSANQLTSARAQYTNTTSVDLVTDWRQRLTCHAAERRWRFLYWYCYWQHARQSKIVLIASRNSLSYMIGYIMRSLMSSCIKSYMNIHVEG